jgi:L-lactate dehydrogenase complex protein LldE
MVDMFQPQTGVAAVKVLRAAGCEVSCPMGQTCCGQPAWNSGFAAEAANVAKTTLDALHADIAGGADAVVVPAGSCATMMKVFWPEMFELAGDSSSAERARGLGTRTYEFSSFVDERRRAGHLPDMALRDAPTVAYHHSCHMLRELRIDAPPTALVKAAGCDIAEWNDDRRCCGFGGLFSVKLPETSVAMADEKLRSLSADVDLLVGSDGSCLMHLRGRIDHEHRNLPARHLAELLADALDGAAAASAGAPTAEPTSEAST